ncbi:hypothetical protein SAMN04487850_2025 [Prevotella aff. ruminicola Tc2-24]|uniref:Dolichyl-phosphate-mannose-protein mannosyltransferase n=3 Tax=Prevotella TaxID=838 RepID=A0A1I0PXE3_9BACT|nr:hypothetical protein SAMN04487850_2025 [Prevotella aff. ruminicola Tc2-24]
MTICHSKSQWISILVIFVVLLGIRIYYIGQKKSMHADEAISISISNRNEYGFWSKNYELNHEYTAKELKDISLWDNASVKDALSDVYHMHQVNRDAPHSNFYYSLFRLWFTGVKTSNLNYIYWRGCLLNVVFFAISFFFMALLIRRFTDHWVLLSLGLLIAFINPASLSLTVFMRPYELQQTFVIILTYFVTCCIQAKQAGETIETKKTLAVGSVTLALTMLAAYINLILIGFYGLFIIIYCIRKKDYRLLGFFIMMFIAALIVAKLLYFDFGNLGYREQDATNNLQSSVFLANIVAMKNAILKLTFTNVFFGLFCQLTVIAIICTAFAKETKEHISPILPVIAVINLITFFVIMYLVPIDMKFLRYVAPLFPIFALGYISMGDLGIPKLVLPATAVTLLVLSLIQFNGKRSIVEHLDDAYISVLFKDIKDTNAPIFIKGEMTWKHAYLIPFLNDDSKIIFISNFSEIPERYAEKMPCVYVNEIEGDFENSIDVDLESYTEKLYVQRLTPVHYHNIHMINHK